MTTVSEMQKGSKHSVAYILAKDVVNCEEGQI